MTSLKRNIQALGIRGKKWSLIGTGFVLIQLAFANHVWAKKWNEESALAVLEEAGKPGYRNEYPREELLQAGKYLFDGCGDMCLLFMLKAFDPTRPRERQFLDKAILAYAKKNGSYILDHMDRYLRLPNANKIIRIAAEHSAEGAVKNESLYKGKPFADSLFKASVLRLAAESPEAVLELADRYADRPFGEAVIRKAAAIRPGVALKYSNRFRGQSYAKAILDEAWALAPEKEPGYFLDSLEQFLNRPDLERALLIAVSKAPMEVVKAGAKVLKCPGGDSLLRMATYGLANEDPTMLLYLVRNGESQPIGSAVLELAVRKASLQKDHNGTFFSVKLFRDKPYAREVMLNSLENGGDMWGALGDIIDLPYAEELLKAGAKRDPWQALREISKYEKKPFGYDVVRIAAEGSPQGVFLLLGYNPDFPITIELRKRAESRLLEGRDVNDSCFVWGYQKEFKDKNGVRKFMEKARVDEKRCREILDD